MRTALIFFLAVLLVEIGAPGLVGAKAGGGKIGAMVRRYLKDAPPQQPTTIRGRNALQKMIGRLVTVELTNGYAYALDPTFAHRTLALGDEAYPLLAKAAKSNLSLPARNAVAVLSNYPQMEAAADLVRIL